MADFDDLQLDRPVRPAVPSGPRLPAWLLLVVAVFVIGFGALWYFTSRGTSRSANPATTTGSVGIVQSTPPTRLQAEPGEQIDLPPLDETDPLVRTLVGRLSAHPQIVAWLATDHLIRNMAVSVANVASGQTPAKQLGALRPVGQFAVRQSGGDVILDPSSYRRYDNIASAIDGLDARGVARFYATVKPRLDDAYRELGSTDDDFDRTVERAIVALLQTPVVEGEIRLRADSVSYKFADPALEGLTKAQRQFLRMGPRNMRIVKAKLRDVARYLGIPESSLPPASG